MNRLALKALAFFVAMSALMGVITTFFLVKQAERLIKEQTMSFARSITQSAREEFSRLPDTRSDTLQQFFENQMGLLQVLRLRVVDAKGGLVASHRYVGGAEGAFRGRGDMPLDALLNRLLAARDRQSVQFMVDTAAGGERAVLQSAAPSWETGRHPLKAAAWVTQRGLYVGMLEIEFSLDEAVAMRQRARDRFWLAMIVWGMMFTLAQTLLLSRWILFPVKYLMEVAGRVAAGDEAARARLVGTDEIADLGRSLNHMADSLHDQKNRLASQNEELIKKEALMQQELRLARVVQSELMRGGEVQAGRLRCLGRVKQMNEVGGDFFEIIPTHDGGLVVAVGDVCGKGVPAALVMMLVMSELKDALREATSPAQAVTLLNERLSLRLAGQEEVAFITLLLCQVSAAGDEVRVVRAGHTQPLLVRQSPAGEVAITPLTARGMPLGLDETQVFTERREALAPGDRLLLFSDGVLDVRGKKGALTEEAFTQMIRQCATQPGLAMVDHLFGELLDEASHRKDDLTLVGLWVANNNGDV